MTTEQMRNVNPIVNWILGGAATLLLAICSFFIVQLYQDFKDFTKGTRNDFKEIMLEQTRQRGEIDRNAQDIRYFMQSRSQRHEQKR